MTLPARTRRGRAAAFAATAVLALAACGGDDSSSGGNGAASGGDAGTSNGDAAAIDLAKAEQEAASFRTLGMPDDWINFGALFQSLCDTYDLGCNGSAVDGTNRVDTDMSSAEEIAAFKSETSNTGMCADIGIAFGQVAEREGVLLEYLPPAAADLPAAYKATDGGWVASAVGVISIMTNTDVVPDPPRSFADLLKPEYQGLITISNPVTSGTGQATVFSSAAALSDTPGEFDLDKALAFWAEFIAKGQKNPADFSAAAFERGETPIRLAYDFVNLQTARLAEEKGIGVEIVIPAEGGVWSPSATMCNKRTEDPNLARLTLDHTLSEAGQLTFAEVGARPVLYTLGKLEVPEELKANWLPEEQYAKVIQYPGDEWPDPAVVAERWEAEVLAGG